MTASVYMGPLGSRSPVGASGGAGYAGAVAGGGGATAAAGGTSNGGPGAPGCIIVWEYS